MSLSKNRDDNPRFVEFASASGGRMAVNPAQVTYIYEQTTEVDTGKATYTSIHFAVSADNLIDCVDVPMDLKSVLDKLRSGGPA